MPTSDEAVQKKADDVQSLREKVADAEANRVTRERELSNDITMRQLEAEEARLEAALSRAKQDGKVASVKAGADAPLSAIQEEMATAVAARDAATTPPPSADNDEKGN